MTSDQLTFREIFAASSNENLLKTLLLLPRLQDFFLFTIFSISILSPCNDNNNDNNNDNYHYHQNHYYYQYNYWIVYFEQCFILASTICEVATYQWEYDCMINLIS